MLWGSDTAPIHERLSNDRRVLSSLLLYLYHIGARGLSWQT